MARTIRRAALPRRCAHNSGRRVVGCSLIARAPPARAQTPRAAACAAARSWCRCAASPTPSTVTCDRPRPSTRCRCSPRRGSCASTASPARSSRGSPNAGRRSDDGRTFTLTLRKGVTFSDGAPFTSADVVFSFRVLYDPAVDSVLASAVKVHGQPLQVTAPDERHRAGDAAGPLRAWPRAARQRPDLLAARARSRARRAHVSRRLEPDDAAGNDGGTGTIRGRRARARSAHHADAQSPLLARRRIRRRRCRTSIAS